MDDYNIIGWINYFEKTNDMVNPQKDFLDSGSRILYPGRFYVLKYISQTKERYNTRPVLISLGISKKDPESFLCIDLSVLPKNIRLKFIEMYFNLYKVDIIKNINQYPFVKDADKQSWMKSFTYDNICKTMNMIPLKHAIKRYKIKNTLKIYSIPFNNVYKIVGKYCDENWYVNGTINDVQKEFIEKMRTLR